MESYSTFEVIALKMLEIQDDECPLKAISSDVQVDSAEHFLKVVFDIQTLQLIFLNSYYTSV